MYRWALVGLAAVGCGFDPRGAAGDGDGGGDGDGPGAPVDGGPDAGATCTIAPTGPIATSSQLASSTGGGPRAPLVCPAGQWAVAAAFDLTNDPIANHGGERLIDGLAIRCGAVSLVAGAPEVVRGELQSVVGGDTANCSAYFATTRSDETPCPTGSVWVGLSIHRPDDVLFNDVGLRCATLAADGSVGTTIATVPVPGTGTSSSEVQVVDCPAGTAVIGLTARSGCGIDGLSLQCQALACGL
jgi:hypothetical protein